MRRQLDFAVAHHAAMLPRDVVLRDVVSLCDAAVHRAGSVSSLVAAEFHGASRSGRWFPSSTSVRHAPGTNGAEIGGHAAGITSLSSAAAGGPAVSIRAKTSSRY